MLGRRRRSLSQRNYLAVQAIHAENDRLKQVDRGMGYRHFAKDARAHERIGGGAADIPLHIGPAIEAVPTEDGWAA